MRVVAGTARGLRLVAPPGTGTRPTSDRVREAMFNSLHSRAALEGAHVLDLYAGTGALGIEALSRGAASAVFVENRRVALTALRANLQATKLAAHAEVLGIDVGAALDVLARDRRTFDLALIDPPYSFNRWTALLQRVPAALAVVESDRPILLDGDDPDQHTHRHHHIGADGSAPRDPVRHPTRTCDPAKSPTNPLQVALNVISTRRYGTTVVTLISRNA